MVRNFIGFTIAHIFLAAIFIAATINILKYKNWKKLYFIVSSGVTLVGIAGAVWVLEFPPEKLDEQGRLSGEMPIEFGGALMIIFVGTLASLIGFIAIAFQRWCLNIIE
ncbi:hypothetical protein CFB82_40100 [Burkholderia sp. HI2714]|uniref:hypothetical protein n=1 Tax=Burkholderia sp. HI2714 TaxID=2015359 RepID=UPI000B7A542F|nr:hypothetical protein [Burkholderia sp. HI2714]OXJ22565.1 hypothetical protein CFB82_40100 [Burkholderia sp. HI2714]